MKRVIKALINKMPYIGKLREQVRKQGAYPAGHYYSPIPAEQDVLFHIKSSEKPGHELLGIDLNVQCQRDSLYDYANFYRDLPFPENQTLGRRYFYDNPWFSYSDAIFLYCFLRKFAPKKIIEIGSGYSSAVMLDTIDVNLFQQPDITFIDPYPERLISLLREGDRERVKIIDKKIQEISLDELLGLDAGDLLFVDSSHIVKCESDVKLLIFEILPRLREGVFVHFHDVFYPFEYPFEWLKRGIYWNENYFLRAFLSYNNTWKIQFFNTYVHFIFGDYIRKNMPLCCKDPGGSLYIQRVSDLGVA